MIIGIGSGKGGSGKSVCASNLSYYYSLKNKKILLLDADWGMSNTGYFLNVFPKNSICDFLYIDEKNKTLKTWDEIKLKVRENLDFISIGHGKKNISDISNENYIRIVQEIKKDEQKYDAIIIDSSPGSHENVMDMLKICNKIVILLTTTYPSAANGYGLIKVLKNDYQIASKLYIIVNMESDEKQAKMYADSIVDNCNNFLKTNVKYLGNINNSTNVQKSIENQNIFLEKYGDTTVGKQIKLIGDLLWR